MELITIAFIFVAIIIIILGKLLFDIRKRLNISEELVQWLKDVSRKMEFSSLTLDTKLTNTFDSINTRIDKTMSALADVQKSFGELSELSKTVKDVSLLFRNPKGRGAIGETLLQNIIKDILPRDAYRFQHSFLSGDIVDAVVKAGKMLIPIDAKFPMNNFIAMVKLHLQDDRSALEKQFEADVKKHIETISKKYIKPEEGTSDYAIMYIPSESVFYDVIRNEKLSIIAQENRILMTSPMSLHMYLKAIFMSYQGQHIQEQARNVIALFNGLITDFNEVKKSYEILYRHINHVYKQAHVVGESLERAGKNISSLHRMSARQIE